MGDLCQEDCRCRCYRLCQMRLEISWGRRASSGNGKCLVDVSAIDRPAAMGCMVRHDVKKVSGLGGSHRNVVPPLCAQRVRKSILLKPQWRGIARQGNASRTQSRQSISHRVAKIILDTAHHLNMSSPPAPRIHDASSMLATVSAQQEPDGREISTSFGEQSANLGRQSIERRRL